MTHRPQTIAWFSFFPVEWLPDVPEPLRRLPRLHPATWQRVLLTELEKNPSLRLHILILRKHFEKSLSFDRNGVTFHLIKTPGGFRAPSLFWLDTFLIKRALKEIQPDLVHAWGTENGAALVASRLGFPYLVTMQGLISWIAQVGPVNRYQRLAALLENWSLSRASVVTAESTFAVGYLQRKFPHLQVRQIEHAPDQLFHQVQRRPQINPIRFIFIGGLSYLKGADLLLHALDRIKINRPFQLTVVGKVDEPFLRALRTTLSPELWPRIQFRVNLTSQAVAQELAAATMMIYPTRVDNSPNVVKEAVVAGVPVVASAVGGITDYVFPGENGLLFPAENLDQFIAVIQSACEHPLFSQGQVAAATLVKTRDYLSPQRMGQSFSETYSSFANQAGAKRGVQKNQ